MYHLFGSAEKRRQGPAAALGAALALACVPASALGHAERPSFFPAGDGVVPKYRTTGPSIVVCQRDSAKRINRIRSASVRRRNTKLLRRCSERNIQDAVDHARSGTRILVLPGVYTEPASRRVGYPDPKCLQYMVPEAGPRRPGQTYRKTASYEYELCSPNSNAMIAILGDSRDADRRCDHKCRIQIEGTGARPSDVLIEGDGRHLNVIKADRADGVYLTNFEIEYSDFNNVYIHETDGFVMRRIVSRWSREYGLLSFTSDHGVYADNDTYGNGDSGIYPGSGPQTTGGRYGIVVERNDLHDNLQGTASAAGDNILWRDNDVHDNGVGFVTDSFSPGHPGSPENHSMWTHNRIHDNNRDDFFSSERDTYCKRPPRERDLKIVCPAIGIPTGVGVLIAGGNENLVTDNDIWGNRRYGVMQFWVEAVFRGVLDPALQFDTSNGNVTRSNRLGRRPDGTPDPNGLDFFWDEQGAHNCWEANQAGEGGPIHSDPAALPACPGSALSLPVNPLKHAFLVPCAAWDPQTLTDPPACDWFEVPSSAALARTAALRTPRGCEFTRSGFPACGGPLPVPLAGPLAWASPPVVLDHPTLPGDHILIGELVNRSLGAVSLASDGVHALAGAQPLRNTATVFASGYAPVVHLWNRRIAPPGYDLARVGRTMSIQPGRRTPVVVAWHGGAAPTLLDYGAGQLPIPAQ
jgi:hypothetical protein